jgi:hypothetical protein
MNKGQLQDIVMELAEKNPLGEIARFEAANGDNVHRGVRQGSLPDGTLVAFNEGVTAEADTVTPFTEEIAMYELRSQVDVRLAKQSGNAAKYRAQRDAAAREGLMQTVVNDFFYGDKSSNVRKFDGLATRLASTSQTDAQGRSTVISNGGSSNLSSIYVVQFGDMKNSLVYPKSHPSAGIESEDMDDRLVDDADGNSYPAYVTWHRWYLGFANYDTRALRRIANIDTSSGAANGFDPDALISLLVDLPDDGAGAHICMNRDVYTQLLKNAKDKMNVSYDPNAPYGPKTRSDFIGYPIRIFDRISSDETQVS